MEKYREEERGREREDGKMTYMDSLCLRWRDKVNPNNSSATEKTDCSDIA